MCAVATGADSHVVATIVEDATGRGEDVAMIYYGTTANVARLARFLVYAQNGHVVVVITVGGQDLVLGCDQKSFTISLTTVM